MLSAYLIHLLILIGIHLILTISLQLALGYTGLLNLGHIAFYAVGAYTSALLTLHGMPFLVGLIAAGVIAAILGGLLALPTNRLKGDYLALATLGFSFVIFAITLNWTSLTRGPLGLPGIPKPSILGISFADNISFLILTLIMALLTYVIIRKIVGSPFGRVLEAIRDDELATRVLGKRTNRVKTIAMSVSAFFAGIAGSLYAHYISFIDPSSFTILQLIPIICMVVIGGVASLRGTIIATIVLILIPEPLRFIGFPSAIVGPIRQMIYALILIVMLIYKPKGFYGKVELE